MATYFNDTPTGHGAGLVGFSADARAHSRSMDSLGGANLRFAWQVVLSRLDSRFFAREGEFNGTTRGGGGFCSTNTDRDWPSVTFM